MRTKRIVYAELVMFVFIFSIIGVIGSEKPVHALQPTPEPVSVTIAGSLQDELGCPGDWQPECVMTHLTYDPEDDVWQGIFTIPAGSWEYKAALNDAWAENYGVGAVRDGPNIQLILAAPTDVKFYYDHKTHWITDNANSIIATVPGSYQDELGCSGDWQPDCLRSWLQDPDGDGIYTFASTAIPVGSYEVKVAIKEAWDENYGADGIRNGPNIPFTIPEDGLETIFRYDSNIHLLSITVVTETSPATIPIFSDAQNLLSIALLAMISIILGRKRKRPPRID